MITTQQLAWVCKRCGGPAPTGIGYVVLHASAEAAAASAAISMCWCGHSARQIGHAADATYDPAGGHGYPWRPECACGWTGRHMVTQDAALQIAADHAAGAL